MNDRQLHLEEYEHRTHRVHALPRGRCHELVPHTIPQEPERGGLVRCITWAAVLVFALGTGLALINAVEYITATDMIGMKQ